MTCHVLLPDNIAQAALDVLLAAPEITCTAGNLSRQETLAAVSAADALIVRSATRVDQEMLEAAPRLRVVARAGVGVDNIDLPAATQRGVVVMNAPDGNTISTAEHTLGLLLALARHIPDSQESLRQGRWDRKAFEGVELRGKVLGIIGFGRVGRAVARLAGAFDMRLLACDPWDDPGRDRAAHELGVELVELDDIYTRSDFITLHPLLNDSTRHMINAVSLNRMKRGVRIINTARGALIVESDLADAIRSGQVAGAALDVYEQEPPSPDHPLIGLPGVVHTPHLAASTAEAQIAVAVLAAQQVIDALLHHNYRNVRNPEVLQPQEPAVPDSVEE